MKHNVMITLPDFNATQIPCFFILLTSTDSFPFTYQSRGCYFLLQDVIKLYLINGTILSPYLLGNGSFMPCRKHRGTSTTFLLPVSSFRSAVSLFHGLQTASVIGYDAITLQLTQTMFVPLFTAVCKPRKHEITERNSEIAKRRNSCLYE